MLGAGAVGKTATTVRIVANEFRYEYDYSYYDDYQCEITVDGQNEPLDILDTAGQDQFAALRNHWIREYENIYLI